MTALFPPQTALTAALTMINFDHEIGVDWNSIIVNHWHYVRDSLFKRPPDCKKVLIHHFGYFSMDHRSANTSEKKLCAEIRRLASPWAMHGTSSLIWLDDSYGFFPDSPFNLGQDIILRQLSKALEALNTDYDGQILNTVLVMPSEVIAAILQFLSASCSCGTTKKVATRVEQFSQIPEVIPSLVHSTVRLSSSNACHCQWTEHALGQCFMRQMSSDD